MFTRISQAYRPGSADPLHLVVRFSSVFFVTLFSFTLVSAALLAQQTSNTQQPASPQHCFGCELPITLRQNIEAGKTKVGSKVQAKLAMATLLKGGVIPRNATLTGEVIESSAKSATEPSRLSIRMDSAQWKDGSAKFKIYLTAWYYPPAPLAAQDLTYGAGDGQRTRNPGGPDYTDPKNPMSQQRFPPRDNNDSSTADGPASSISRNRVLMTNVDSTRNSDGSVALVSTHSNIKLDKVTTYVLAADELIPGKQ
jgi:hypothetical protein